MTRGGKRAAALLAAVAVASASALTLAGCATERAPVEAPPALAWLSFLDEPGMTREAVDRRLGAPRAVYEADRVASYRLRVRRPWYDLRERSEDVYSLVVAFDEGGHVRRHALVPQPDAIDAPEKR